MTNHPRSPRPAVYLVLGLAFICGAVKIDGLLQRIPPPVISAPSVPLWEFEDGMDDFGAMYIPNRIPDKASTAWK